MPVYTNLGIGADETKSKPAIPEITRVTQNHARVIPFCERILTLLGNPATEYKSDEFLDAIDAIYRVTGNEDMGVDRYKFRISCGNCMKQSLKRLLTNTINICKLKLKNDAF